MYLYKWIRFACECMTTDLTHIFMQTFEHEINIPLQLKCTSHFFTV